MGEGVLIVHTDQSIYYMNGPPSRGEKRSRLDWMMATSSKGDGNGKEGRDMGS